MINKKNIERLEKVEAVTKRLGKKTPSYVVVVNPGETYEDKERKLEELRRAWEEYGEPREYPIIIIGGSDLKKAAGDGVHVDQKPVCAAEEVHGTH
jgi:thiamine monophosphate synthase